MNARADSPKLADRYELAFELYPYARSADQDADGPVRHPVVVVGGGVVGLSVALDLGLRGQPVVVLDDHEGAGLGSRAICFAKRSLEIAHRLGAGEAMLEKGVVWQKGRVFHGRDEIFGFDLLPEQGHRYPAFVNLQQPYAEKFLHDAIRRAVRDGARIDIRGRNRVDAVERAGDRVTLAVETPDGPYDIQADWVVACDGARSPVRSMMGLAFDGRVFEDNFLIADVKMTADFPVERWFWFDPWFKSGASALLHKQPDDIWRIDFQLGWNIDREAELDEGRIRERVDAMLGDGVSYELDWASIYTFQCRRMERFRHGPVLFAGDSAHQVSPFGARGANSGIQDADNLGWKLDLVLRGQAPDALLDSYASEREAAADENILNSTRTTDFLTPKTKASRMLRDAVLGLAAEHEFARPIINSGRLSVPYVYDSSGLNGEDALADGPARTRPGASALDAPLGRGFLLDRLTGEFCVLAIATAAPVPSGAGEPPARTLHVPAEEVTPALRERYLGENRTAVYLIRPDQHIAARWRDADARTIDAAIGTAVGRTGREHRHAA